MIITDVFQSEKGNEVTIKTEMGDKYIITLSDAKELGIFGLSDDEFPIEFDDEEYILLLCEKLKAIKYCLYLLSFSDKSKMQLFLKLREKQYSATAIDLALEVLERGGVLDDKEACLKKAQYLANTKFFGPHRIKAYLLSKGYSSDGANFAAFESEIDYESALLSLIQKLSGSKEPHFEDSLQLSKFKAKLARYGYDLYLINKLLSDFFD